MFPMGSGVGAQGPDHLTFDLADASKMSLSFYGKRPGPGMRLDKQSLQFAMHDTGMVGDVLEAYERLILDAMRGDHTLFTTAEGIERLWEVSIPLLEAPPPVRLYPPGGVGTEIYPSAGRPPRMAAALRASLAGPKPRGWLNVSPRACRSAGAIRHNETEGRVSIQANSSSPCDVLCPRGFIFQHKSR
jgi:glucose-6-phosphate 1-dehydrogenase